jgi:hypothetical protein
MDAADLGSNKQITFFDNDGIRWTVVPIRAGRVLGAGPVGLEFTSDDGERRVANADIARGVTWQTIDDKEWRALLRDALLVT